MNVRRPWARPLVPLYRAVQAVASQLRRPARRLGWPVVSVGSISAGGAGKTPVVIALAEMFTARGWDVDVLTRGYGRLGRLTSKVVVDMDAAAHFFGDEPVLIARRTGVPVWVGASRFDAGRVAEARPVERPAEGWIRSTGNHDRDRREEGGDADRGVNTRGTAGNDPKSPGTGTHIPFGEDGRRQVHLLDDGFQHRRLHRDFDVVLVTAEDLDDLLLPAGNLREPVETLRRADAVVIRTEEAEQVEERLLRLLRAGPSRLARPASKQPGRGAMARPEAFPEEEFSDAPVPSPRPSALVGVEALVWQVRRTLQFPAPLFCFGAGLRPMAFCAIARPEGFAAMLDAAGCGVVETMFFADHHQYDLHDVEQIVRVAKGLNASGLVTTDKDAVKLRGELWQRLEAGVGPLMVAELQVEFVYPERVMRELEARLFSAAASASGFPDSSEAAGV